MGGALEAVLRLKDQEQQRQQAEAENAFRNVQLFQQVRQQAQANQLAQLQQAQQSKLQDAQIENLNRKNISLDPNNSINNILNINNKLKDILPDYRAEQNSSGDIVIQPKPISGNDFMMGIKEDQFKQKRLQTMGDDLDPSKNVRNPYGVAQLGLNRAERIEGLVNQYKDLNLDRRVTEELAIGLNSMLQGSNVSARSQVESLIPSSIRGNAQKMIEWLVNEPQGLKQQKFVQRMLNDVIREKQIFQGQVQKFARAKVSKYSDVINKYPEEATGIMKSFGIDPEEYNNWKKSGYKSEDVTKIDNNGVQQFNVGGVIYNIPDDKVDAFKKAKGIK